jgi:hypothetical protein
MLENARSHGFFGGFDLVSIRKTGTAGALSRHVRDITAWAETARSDPPGDGAAGPGLWRGRPPSYHLQAVIMISTR